MRREKEKIEDKSLPLVSCIMPTYNRRTYVPKAIEYFIKQDYPYRELIIVDDGTDIVKDLVPEDSRIRYMRLDKRLTVGAKRNIACKQAAGEIIVHWDDDDWMAPHRISYQVENLLKEQADICGLDHLYFYNPLTGNAWQYVYPEKSKPWVYGGTLCYKKTSWSNNHFADIKVGEDNLFVWSNCSKKITALQDNTFYVGLIHESNTSPKRTNSSRWNSRPLDLVHGIMGEDWHYYELNSQKSADKKENNNQGNIKEPVQPYPIKPKVTCILITNNRRKFIPQAIKYFLQQDYPEKQLIILDDGKDEIRDLVPQSVGIDYIRLPEKLTVGEKRNRGIEASQGEIILLWDDDDWYGNHRISYQVEPIIRRKADATVLQDGLVLDLVKRKFWTCKPELRDRMFAFGVIAGTIAFRKSLFNRQIRFPKVNLAEDAAFLKLLDSHHLKVKKMPANDQFIYIRHQQNTWVFSNWQTFNNSGWQPADPPSFLPPDDLHFYGLSLENQQSKNQVVQCPPDKVKGASHMIDRQETNIPLSTRGAVLYRNGAYNEALICLEKAAQKESNNPWILFDTGLCYLALNRFNEALSMIQSALAKIPANTWVWSALGITLARQGQYEKARDAFVRSRKISSKNNEAMLFLDGLPESNLIEAIGKYEQKDYNQALTYLDAAILKDPRNHRAFLYKGKTLLALEQPEHALSFLLSADLLNPNQAHILLQVGYALNDLGHHEQAQLFFKRSLEIDAGFSEAQKASFLLEKENLVKGTSTGYLEFIKYLDTGSGSLIEDYIFLYGITRLLRPNLILETGTNTGVSSIVFAKAMRDSNIDGKIITVDYNKQVLKTAGTQIQKQGLDKYIKIFAGESLKVLPEILKKYHHFDLCFLDGNHHYSIVKEEFEQVKQYCRYILLHDSYSFTGVKKLVEELSQCPDCQVVKLIYPPGAQWSQGKVRYRSSPGITLVEVDG